MQFRKNIQTSNLKRSQSLNSSGGTFLKLSCILNYTLISYPYLWLSKQHKPEQSPSKNIFSFSVSLFKWQGNQGHQKWAKMKVHWPPNTIVLYTLRCEGHICPFFSVIYQIMVFQFWRTQFGSQDIFLIKFPFNWRQIIIREGRKVVGVVWRFSSNWITSTDCDHVCYSRESWFWFPFLYS